MTCKCINKNVNRKEKNRLFLQSLFYQKQITFIVFSYENIADTFYNIIFNLGDYILQLTNSI